VPEPGAAVALGNERLARAEPRVEGGAFAVVYDGRGEVAARIVLPAGTRPWAVSRDPAELLVLGPGDEPALCVTGQAPRVPTRLDPTAALASPTDGTYTCER
jgi:hypothetical protein